jgi:hypothetical protein
VPSHYLFTKSKRSYGGFSGMDYRVMIVSDHTLPSDIQRVMVENDGGPPVLMVAEATAGNWRFLQEWEQLYDGDDVDGYVLRAV